jgi:hypothetical protein
MGKKEKLISRLRMKPRDFSFDEAEALMLSLGFKLSNKGKTSGSRVLFTRDGVPFDLHKPHPRKELPAYQVVKLLKFLEREGLI